MRNILAIGIFLICKILSAQPFVSPTENVFQTNFLRGDFEWNWLGNFSYYKEAVEGAGISIRDNFRSNLIMEGRLWQEQNNLDGYLFFKTPNTYHGIFVKSWYLQDLKNQEIMSRFGNHSMGLKAQYHTGPFFILSPYAGYQKSENRNLIDWGWDLGIDARLNKYPLGDYRTDVHIRSDHDLYPQRQNAFNAFDVRLKTNFSPIASDSLMMHYSKDNQEYFASDGISLIDVKIENMGFENFLYYQVSPRRQIEFKTLLLSRTVDDNTPGANNRRDVERFENTLFFRHTGSQLSMLLSIHTFQESQDNLEVVTDSKAMQTSLRADFSYRLNSRDIIILKLGLIKFQYDTPDTLTNNDDRDESRFIGSIEYSRRFSNLFEANIEFFTNIYHKLYIYREQSANNNRNRIYKLQASTRYSNQHLRNILMTYVLANYTIYDFDAQFTNRRSFVFRKYVLSDSLEITVLPRTALGFLGRLELDDRGTFYEEDFTQGLLESGRSIFYDIYLEQKSVLNFIVMAGVSVYQRDSWRHMPAKIQDRKIRKTSPYIRIVYPLSRHIRFNAYLCFTMLRDEGRIYTDYPMGNLNLMFLF